MLDNSNWHKKN